MPKRTVDVVFYNYVDKDGVGRTAYRGDEVDFSDAEIKRGDAHGAFKESERSPATDPLAAGTSSPRQGGIHTPPGRAPLRATGVPTVASELTDEEIDSLSGPALDEAAEQAGVDVTAGGSLANGAMSADEKRSALKARNAEARSASG